MTRSLPFHVYDVFTGRVFGGNPLAVFPEVEGVPDGTLQNIAREMNLSETVFLGPPTTEDGTCRVRIFTPTRELPFAGHPTLGAAWHVVAEGWGRAARDGGRGGPGGGAPGGGDGPVVLRLDEGVGRVPVEVEVEGGRPRFARLTAAVAPELRDPPAPASELAAMLGLDAADVGGPGGHAPRVASAGLPFTMVPLRDLDALGRARIETAAWERVLRGRDEEMVYAFAPDGKDADYRVRMFCPGLGFPEDPATGSAAAAFAGYLAAHAPGDGERAWTLDQGIEMGRPSRLEIDVRVEGGRVTRIRVGGTAVHVSRGTMEVPT